MRESGDAEEEIESGDGEEEEEEEARGFPPFSRVFGVESFDAPGFLHRGFNA